ncbi:hypothetical protein CSPX01_14593 [Colletotrichum filicis]|nr:hypothetical protein CSPX01_14593 [Colletotrichum filicis]
MDPEATSAAASTCVQGFLGRDATEDEGFLDIAGTFIISQIVYAPSQAFRILSNSTENGENVVVRQMNNKKANDLIPLSDPPSVLDYVKDDGRYLDNLRLQMDES